MPFPFDDGLFVICRLLSKAVRTYDGQAYTCGSLENSELENTQSVTTTANTQNPIKQQNGSVSRSVPQGSTMTEMGCAAGATSHSQALCPQQHTSIDPALFTVRCIDGKQRPSIKRAHSL